MYNTVVESSAYQNCHCSAHGTVWLVKAARRFGHAVRLRTGARDRDVTVTGTGNHGDDRRERVRDGGDRRGAAPANERGQLSDSVLGGRRPACCRSGHAAGRHERRDARVAARTSTVRRLGVLRRALLYRFNSASGRHLGGPLLGGHARRLHTSQASTLYITLH